MIPTLTLIGTLRTASIPDYERVFSLSEAAISTNCKITAWKNTLFLLIVSRTTLLLVAVFSTFVLTMDHGTSYHGIYERLIKIWIHKDSPWYLTIINNGYDTAPDPNPPYQANYAYFPLYPMLVKAVSYIIGDPLISGLLVSNLALSLGMYWLYRFVQEQYGDDTAFRTVLYTLAFPVSFFFSSFYTESLFFLCVIGSFCLARREKWLWVGVLGFSASLTRANGVLLLVPMLLMYLERKHYSLRRIRPDILWLGLVPLGVATYATYLYFHTGDFLAFLHIQGSWGHKTAFAVWEYIKHPYIVGLWGNDFGPTSFASVIIFAVLIYLVFKRLGYIYGLYALISAFFPLMAGTLLAAPRYLMLIFPAFIVLALYGKNRYVEISYLMLSLILSGYALIVFVTGHLGGIT